MTMIPIHAPTEEKDDQIKKQFYNSLERVYDTTPNYDMQVVLGDFNAKAGKEQYLALACSRHSLHVETNDKGRKMVDFTTGKDMAITGTWYQHKRLHKAMWHSPNNTDTNFF
jgi:endonuclease/exonuclease/phosphatase family metal-dependent hydrolase